MVTPLNPNASASVTETAALKEPSAGGSTTADPIRVPDAVEKFFGSAPEFIRVPDVQRIFGIKRGLLYTLIGNGAVKSICLRQRGCKTGVRLVSYASLREYLHKRLA